MSGSRPESLAQDRAVDRALLQLRLLTSFLPAMTSGQRVRRFLKARRPITHCAMSTFRNSFGAALSIPDVWPRPSFDRGPEWVKGGKTRSEHIFSELPQIADIVRSRFTIRRAHSYADHAFWLR